MSFAIKRNDRAPSIQSTITVDDEPVPLTNCVVRFVMRARGSTSAKVNAVATVVDAAAGIVRYDWQPGDTDTPGIYEAEWEVTFAGQVKRTFPPHGFLAIDIEDDLSGAPVVGGNASTPVYLTGIPDPDMVPIATGPTDAAWGFLSIGAIAGLAAGIATMLAAPTSANLKAAITDETGSGSLVFADSPTLVTPTLGAATVTSLTFPGTASTVGSLRFAYNASQTTVLGIKDGGGTDRILIAQGGTNGLIRFGHYAVFDAALQGINAYLDGSSNAYITIGGAAKLTVTSSLATFATSVAMTKSAIGLVSTDGMVLDNQTAATGGTPVQYSTRVRLRGSAWNSVGLSSETHDWTEEVRPASAAGATSSTWVLARSMAGGAYADCLTIASSGAATIAGPLTVNGAAGITVANASGYVGIGSGTMPTAGSVRFPVLGASGTRLVTMTDSGGTTRDLIYLYGANQVQFGNGGNVSSLIGSTVFLGAGPSNIGLFTTSGDFGGGSGVINIKNATTVPTTNPTNGGLQYSEGGAGKWRGSSGTVTTFGPAEPHCPSCGRDFAHEWVNATAGEALSVCVPCMHEEMERIGINVERFAFVRNLKRAS